MSWRVGQLDAHSSYALHEELYTPDGQCVAVLESFASDPDKCFCNALTPQGEPKRRAHCRDFVEVKDWAERITGLKPDHPIYRKEP